MLKIILDGKKETAILKIKLINVNIDCIYEVVSSYCLKISKKILNRLIQIKKKYLNMNCSVPNCTTLLCNSKKYQFNLNKPNLYLSPNDKIEHLSSVPTNNLINSVQEYYSDEINKDLKKHLSKNEEVNKCIEDEGIMKHKYFFLKLIFKNIIYFN